MHEGKVGPGKPTAETRSNLGMGQLRQQSMPIIVLSSLIRSWWSLHALPTDITCRCLGLGHVQWHTQAGLRSARLSDRFICVGTSHCPVAVVLLR